MTFLDLHLILDAYLILLEALLVDLDKVIDTLIWLRMASSQMCADEAETCLKDTHT